MLNTLQAGRGIAALMVVLFHLNVAVFGMPQYWPDRIWSGFDVGHAGVHFFFVLSGFIIAHIHFEDLGDRTAWRRYAFKRFVRIYPVYWLVLIGVLAVYFAMPQMGQGYETRPIELLGSFTLLPTPNPPALTVAWTLRHEVLFYALFAVGFFSRRALTYSMTVWLLGCMVTAIAGSAPYPFGFLFAPINLLFGMGIGAAWLLRTRVVPYPRFVLVIGLVLFAATGGFELAESNGGHWLTLSYGLAGAMVVAGLVEWERSRALAVPRVLTLFGDASYALYLIHFPAISLMAKVFFAAGLSNVMPPAVWFVIMLLAVCALGVAFHLTAERWLLRLLKHRRPAIAKDPAPQ